MKKILITGSGTFVGNEIANYISKKTNYKIFAFYNNSKPKNLKSKVNIFKFDLSKRIIFKKKFDILIHCAFKVPSDGLNYKNYKINISSVNNILKLCKKNGCKKIIFLSAVSLYGLPYKKIINENTFPNDPNLYGKAKIRCESEIIKFCKLNKICCTILRLPGVIGKNSKNNFITEIIQKIKKNNIVKIFNLNQKFNNILHIDLLSQIIIKMIKKENSIETYLIGSIHPIKVKKILSIISKKLNTKIKLQIVRSPNKNFLLSNKKILNKGYKLWSTKKSLERVLN